MDNESIAGVLGFVLLTLGGEARVPLETIEGGLPEGHGIRVYPDGEELVVCIARQEQDGQ